MTCLHRIYEMTSGLLNRPLPSLAALVLALSVMPAPAQTGPGNTTTTIAAEPAKPATNTSSTGSANTGNTAPPSGVSAPSGYQLSPNDTIAVEVFGEEDLKTSARLNGEGSVSLPLIGSVRLGGLTLSQATSRVTELYARDYLVSPRVNLTLLGYAKRRFTMLGQVNRPGSYEMPETSPGGIDLLEAIAMAGGYTRIAAPERINVRRHGPGNTEQSLRVDAKRLARGAGESFKVQSGDTITVGESIF